MGELKKILDVCCGGRMWWFDKEHPLATYIDNREVEATRLSNRAIFKVKPDKVMDFTNLEFEDESFYMVVFDPPHMARAGEKSFLANKYGYLKKDTWQADIKKAFDECWRVLKPNGTLIFKWNESHISLKDVLELAPAQPIVGQRGGRTYKTHFIVFLKP